jgi:hypothetical protein
MSATPEFDALRLAIHGLLRLLGNAAEYIVCVNSISVSEAKRRCGSIPESVLWREAPPDIPATLRPYISCAMAERAIH